MSKILLFIQVFSLSLAVGCKDKNTDPAPEQPNLTTTEQALLGTWTWDKTEFYYYETPVYLMQAIYPNGHHYYYNPDGSVSDTAINSPINLTCDFLSSTYPAGNCTGTGIGVVCHYCNNNCNGEVQQEFWYIGPNFDSAGMDYLFGDMFRNGYIFTLTSNQMELRSTVDSTLRNTQINYWHK